MSHTPSIGPMSHAQMRKADPKAYREAVTFAKQRRKNVYVVFEIIRAKAIAKANGFRTRLRWRGPGRQEATMQVYR